MATGKPGSDSNKSGSIKSSGGSSKSGTGAKPADSAPLAEVKLLTVAEVAAVMRVSKMTVYRLVHAGDLPAVRVGRSYRVSEQAVHDYLRNSYVQAM